MPKWAVITNLLAMFFSASIFFLKYVNWKYWAYIFFLTEIWFSKSGCPWRLRLDFPCSWSGFPKAATSPSKMSNSTHQTCSRFLTWRLHPIGRNQHVVCRKISCSMSQNWLCWVTSAGLAHNSRVMKYLNRSYSLRNAKLFLLLIQRKINPDAHTTSGISADFTSLLTGAQSRKC